MLDLQRQITPVLSSMWNLVFKTRNESKSQIIMDVEGGGRENKKG